MSRLTRRLLCALLVCVAAPVHAAGSVAIGLRVDGIIGPAMSSYVRRGLATAARAHARLVILELDTPGGLDRSMRQIVKAILASPVPVAAYVAPSGARAASAGTYLFYASAVAAMAPATNVGAATPVTLGGASIKGTEGRKTANDAAAYLESLATLRGRNVRFAREAVQRASSLSAAVAVKRHVADFIAADVSALLRQANGRHVLVRGHPQVLVTHGLKVVWLHPGWPTRLLSMTADPTIAYVLMTIGLYGLLFELIRPGLVLPGVAGGLSLLLALYAFQVLPVHYAGFALILLGLIFVGAEAFVPAYGSLGLGGLFAVVAGSLMLFSGVSAVPLTLIIPVTVILAGGMALLAGAAIRSQRRPAMSGTAELVGRMGEVIDLGPPVRVRVRGEEWRAETGAAVATGNAVRVTAVRGLTLLIEPAPKRTENS